MPALPPERAIDSRGDELSSSDGEGSSRSSGFSDDESTSEIDKLLESEGDSLVGGGSRARRDTATGSDDEFSSSSSDESSIAVDETPVFMESEKKTETKRAKQARTEKRVKSANAAMNAFAEKVDGTFCVSFTPLCTTTETRGSQESLSVVGCIDVPIAVVDNEQFAHTVDTTYKHVDTGHICGNLEPISTIANFARRAGKDPATVVKCVRTKLAGELDAKTIVYSQMFVKILLPAVYAEEVHATNGKYRLRVQSRSTTMLGMDVSDSAISTFYFPKGTMLRDLVDRAIVVSESEHNKFFFKPYAGFAGGMCCQNFPIPNNCAATLAFVAIEPHRECAIDGFPTISKAFPYPIVFDRFSPAQDSSDDSLPETNVQQIDESSDGQSLSSEFDVSDLANLVKLAAPKRTEDARAPDMQVVPPRYEAKRLESMSLGPIYARTLVHSKTSSVTYAHTKLSEVDVFGRGDYLSLGNTPNCIMHGAHNDKKHADNLPSVVNTLRQETKPTRLTRPACFGGMSSDELSRIGRWVSEIAQPPSKRKTRTRNLIWGGKPKTRSECALREFIEADTGRERRDAEEIPIGAQSAPPQDTMRLSEVICIRFSLLHQVYLPVEVRTIAACLTLEIALLAFSSSEVAVKRIFNSITGPKPHSLLFAKDFGRVGVNKTPVPNWIAHRIMSLDRASRTRDSVRDKRLFSQLARLVYARLAGVDRFDYSERPSQSQLVETTRMLDNYARISAYSKRLSKVRVDSPSALITDSLVREAHLSMFDSDDCELRVVKLDDFEPRHPGSFIRAAIMDETAHGRLTLASSLLGPSGPFAKDGVLVVRVETREQHDNGLRRAVSDALARAQRVVVLVKESDVTMTRAALSQLALADGCVEIVTPNIITSASKRVVDGGAPEQIVVSAAHTFSHAELLTYVCILSHKNFTDASARAKKPTENFTRMVVKAIGGNEFALSLPGVRAAAMEMRIGARCADGLTIVGLPLTPTSVHERSFRKGASLVDDLYFSARKDSSIGFNRYVDDGWPVASDGSVPFLRTVSGVGGLRASIALKSQRLDEYGVGMQRAIVSSGDFPTTIDFAVHYADLKGILDSEITADLVVLSEDDIARNYTILWPMESDSSNHLRLSLRQYDVVDRRATLRTLPCSRSGEVSDATIRAHTPHAWPDITSHRDVTIVAIDCVPSSINVNANQNLFSGQQILPFAARRKVAVDGPMGERVPPSQLKSLPGSIFDGTSAATVYDQKTTVIDANFTAASIIRLENMRHKERHRLHCGVSLTTILGMLFDRPKRIFFAGDFEQSIESRLDARFQTPRHMLTERERSMPNSGLTPLNWFDSYTACTTSALPYVLGPQLRNVRIAARQSNE